MHIIYYYNVMQTLYYYNMSFLFFLHINIIYLVKTRLSNRVERMHAMIRYYVKRNSCKHHIGTCVKPLRLNITEVIVRKTEKAN